MNRPWMKFYPADWRADPRLRMCSLAARGLWIDLISYMHEGEPYGHLTIDGRAPNLDDIASLVARPRAEVKKALAELEDRQVFSLSDKGAIFSRRMVRDNERSEEGRRQISKRWDDRSPIDDPNRSDSNEPNTYMLDARVQKEREDTADAVPSSATYAFESGIVRLSEKDFKKWEIAFPRLDLRAELTGLSEWANQQSDRWFFALSGALAKRNRTVLEARGKAKEFRTMSGMEGIV